MTLDFPDRVAREGHAAAVPIDRLVLEVTENQAMRDRMALLDIATKLRLKRIGMSVDAFGTGCPSVTQSCDIPFDELKPNRSFVHTP